MTVHTSLDSTTFFHALWIQNELYGKRLTLWTRMMLILIIMALYLTFFEDQSLLPCIPICIAVLFAHAKISKNSRRKVFSDAGERMVVSNGGELKMEYRFEDNHFIAVGPDGEHTFPYGSIAFLAETGEVFLLVIDKRFAHAIRKSDMTREDRRALAAFLSEKTGRLWKGYVKI